ncbi:MAG: hypothetical protein KKB70_03145 [Proteobacteria bacterium]|nr:hypothetical protein [Pseudomonadota bacterium]MBU1611196.1 hypothetical protein [Pseudomonadota bacterium]
MNLENTVTDTFENMPVLLFDDEKGTPIPTADQAFTEQELVVGEILTIKNGKTKHHFVIKRINPENTTEVFVSPAKSNLIQVLMLLSCLAVTWVVLDYFISG